MRKLLTGVILTLFSLAASAQARIQVQAPNLVEASESFNLTFTIEGEHAPSDFVWNCSDDFKVVWGPQKGSSTSISIINGKRSSSSTITYTYVLMPKRAGTFQIPAASATVKGETITSRAATIEVVSGSSSQAQPSVSSRPDGGNERQSSDRSDLYMRLYFSKNKAVVGETLTATLKLYQRTNIAGFEDAKFPTFNGFWSQELQSPSNIEFRRENVGGEIFNSAVLRSWTLIPQQAGDITIEPAELVCLVNIRTPHSSTGSIFDSFFQDDYRTVRKRISTSGTTIHVSALPGGAPASFCGGVGKFSMNASMSKDSLKAHDAASLTITVSGTGNVALLQTPKLKFPPDFELYDVKTTETSTSKTFEFPFIPRSHGDFEIGPVEYSYYDVSAGKYVTLSSPAMKLSVSKGEGSVSYGGQSVAAPVGQKDVRNLGSDIRYIRTGVPSFASGAAFFVGTAGFWILLAGLLLLASACYFTRRKLAAKKADVAGSRNRAANKMARKRLATAGGYLEKSLYTAFYEELHRALLGYISDKLAIDMADMSKDTISERLSENSVPEKLAGEFVGLLDACEYARYSPATDQDSMRTHYTQAVGVISGIDSCMKKKAASKGGVRSSVLGLLLAILLVPLATSAAEPSELWQKAVEAYVSDDYSTAYSSWNEIRQAGVESADLYFNLGNAAFKNGEKAQAVLNYERALKLDPSFSDARFNLEFVSSMILDKVESVPEFFLKTWLKKLGFSMSSNSWCVLFFILFALTLIMVLMFLLGSSPALKRTGFFSGIVLLLLSCSCLAFSVSQKNAYLGEDSAVVMAPVSSVKSAPGESSTDLFVLHEGLKVKVLDCVAGWTNVSLSDGRQGWLKSSDIEII